MDRYSTRINLHGSTQRERIANRLKTTLNNKTINSLSYKKIKLNGVDSELIIDSGTQPYYKDWKSLPNQIVNIGDYVEWANSHWIVTTCDYDDEMYRNGKLVQCNYLLKWQNDHGNIIERWAIIQSASKYNDGTDGNYILTIGSDQLSVVIPLDSESIKLKKSMNKRFFIDNNKESPTAYELTGTGNVTDTYNGHGVTAWIVKECTYTPSELDLKYGVCDYVDFGEHIHKIDKITPDETKISSVAIIGNSEIKIGQKRTYIASLMDDRRNHISWDVSGYQWNAVGDFKINGKVNGNEVEIVIEDENAIDDTFILQLIKTTTGAVISEMEITVVDVF